MTTSPNPVLRPLGPGAVVFLTGATGFLGGELARRMRARGVEVHALVRSNSVVPALAASGIRVHLGDLKDAASIRKGCAGAAAAARATGAAFHVLHCGALISYRTRDRDEAVLINVEGTRSMLDAARREHVARFLFVSSVVAVGESTDGRAIDERAPFNLGHLGVHYTDTKRAAEELVLAAAGGLDVVVANPGAIFGPAEKKSNTLRFLRQVATRGAPIVAPPGSMSVLGIEDAALGTLLALERGRRGERYILSESSAPSRVLFEVIARELGTSPPRFTVPKLAWPLLIPPVALWDAFFPMQFTPPQALQMLGRDLRHDAAKARRELGWAPRPFEDVIRSTIAALRERGDLTTAR